MCIRDRVRVGSSSHLGRSPRLAAWDLRARYASTACCRPRQIPAPARAARTVVRHNKYSCRKHSHRGKCSYSKYLRAAVIGQGVRPRVEVDRVGDACDTWSCSLRCVGFQPVMHRFAACDAQGTA
eukprot:scaffold121987_cov36-Phaeocystis_antarctica.AAC.1